MENPFRTPRQRVLAHGLVAELGMILSDFLGWGAAEISYRLELHVTVLALGALVISLSYILRERKDRGLGQDAGLSTWQWAFPTLVAFTHLGIRAAMIL